MLQFGICQYVWLLCGLKCVEHILKIKSNHKNFVHLFGLYTYRVIHMSMKHFRNLQQMDYTMDHGKSYVDRETLQVFLKVKPTHIVALICC